MRRLFVPDKVIRSNRMRIWGWFSTVALGKRGERLAARYLRRNGYRVVARSLRTKLGEIDLVATKGHEIVFVEVKTRATDDFGGPELAVNRDKRRRITRLAVEFIKARKLMEVAVRFDVIAITWPNRWFATPKIEHFPAAFDADGPWSIG